MNYIVFDLEFNMFFRFRKGQFANPALKNEIIQIGAVKLNERLETIGEFNLIIKPIIYKRINPYVKKKTNINSGMVVKGKSFNEAIESFSAWLGGDAILCSWGHDDILGLRDNCQFYGYDGLSFDKYIDIQQIYMNLGSLSKQPSLEGAVEGLGIEKTSPFHDAFSDAYYTSEIFKKVFDFSKSVIVNWEKDRIDSELRIKELMAFRDQITISCPQCSKLIEKDKEVTKAKKYFAFGYCEECKIQIRHVSRIVNSSGEYSISSNNTVYIPKDASE